MKRALGVLIAVAALLAPAEARAASGSVLPARAPVGASIAVTTTGVGHIDGVTVCGVPAPIVLEHGGFAVVTVPAGIGPGSCPVVVTGAHGVPLTLPASFAVQNTPPQADAGPDVTVHAGTTVTLDGTGSSDPNAQTLHYSWQLVAAPAGSAATLAAPASATTTFTPDVVGTFRLSLTVSDGIATSTAFVSVTATNTAPTAAVAPLSPVEVGTALQLDGSASSDPDGDPLTFHWTVTSAPAGSTAAVDDPSAATTTFTPDLAGTYVFSLVVTDSFGARSTAVTQSVAAYPDTPPIAAMAPVPAEVMIGATLTLDATGSTDPDGDALTYAWSVTSAPDGSAAAVADPTAATTTFTPDVPGLYVLTVVVTDAHGLTAPPLSATVVVEAGPTA